MKKLVWFVSVMLILLFSATAAFAVVPPSVELVCEKDGYYFAGDEWTIVKLDDAALASAEGKENSDKARALEEYVKSNNMTGETGIVNDVGRVTFVVDEGSYILYRSKAVSDQYNALPIFVSLPQVVDGEIYSNLEITAKLSPGNNTGIDTDKGGKPKTGDMNVIYAAAFLCVAAVSAAGVAVVEKKKKNVEG